jgi:hypothetical protein
MPGAMMGHAGFGMPNGTMGNPDLTDQQRQTLSNARRQLPRNPYGLRRGYYPAQAASNPSMQQMPYPQPFQYTPQVQNMQLPQYVPQTQVIGGSSINPHLQQPQFILALPLNNQPAQCRLVRNEASRRRGSIGLRRSRPTRGVLVCALRERRGGDGPLRRLSGRATNSRTPRPDSAFR